METGLGGGGSPGTSRHEGAGKGLPGSTYSEGGPAWTGGGWSRGLQEGSSVEAAVGCASDGEWPESLESTARRGGARRPEKGGAMDSPAPFLAQPGLSPVWEQHY